MISALGLMFTGEIPLENEFVVVFGCVNKLFGLESLIRLLAGLKELSKFPLSSVDTAGGGGTGCPIIFKEKNCEIFPSFLLYT